MEERWLAVVDYEGQYEVSNLGRVRCLVRKRQILKPSNGYKGYWTVPLRVGKGYKNYRLHKIVTRAFLGECPNGHQVNHKNGVKSCNSLENLEYVTPGENRRHAFAMGLSREIGDTHRLAKLRCADIPIIRQRLAAGETQTDIAEDYNVTRRAIFQVKRKLTWRHVA